MTGSDPVILVCTPRDSHSEEGLGIGTAIYWPQPHLAERLVGRGSGGYQAQVTADEVYCYYAERSDSEFICRPRRMKRLKIDLAEMVMRRGEDVNDQVARDARVGTAVMMRHYVKVTQPERRNASNRTFYRIAASLAPATAKRYGHLIAQASREELEQALQAAVEAKDWLRVSQLSVELNRRSG